MANGIEELFPEVFEGQQETQPTHVDVQPSQPSPEVLELRGQVQALQGMVGQIAQQRQQPSGPPPGQVDLQRIFEDQQFFTKDDADRLLTSNDTSKELNQVFNRMKREAVAPVLNIIRAQGETIAHYQQRQANELAAMQQQRNEQEEQSNFARINPDLGNYRDLVRMEAMNLGQEFQMNPSKFAGISSEQVHKLVGDRARAKLQSWGVNVENAPSETPQVKRAGFMERGSGARVPVQSAKNDPNKSALDSMSKFMRGQRSR